MSWIENKLFQAINKNSEAQTNITENEWEKIKAQKEDILSKITNSEKKRQFEKEYEKIDKEFTKEWKLIHKTTQEELSLFNTLLIKSNKEVKEKFEKEFSQKYSEKAWDVRQFLNDIFWDKLTWAMGIFNEKEFSNFDNKKWFSEEELKQFKEKVDKAIERMWILGSYEKFKKAEDNTEDYWLWWSNSDKFLAKRLDMNNFAWVDVTKKLFDYVNEKVSNWVWISSEELEKMRNEKFDITSLNNMEDFAVVLWTEIWEWLEMILRFLLNIGAWITLLPRYLENKSKIEWKVDTPEEVQAKIENERLLKDNPSLWLVELASNWVEILKEIWEKMKTWSNWIVAEWIVTIAWLIAGWAWAVKFLWKTASLAWKTSKLSKFAKVWKTIEKWAGKVSEFASKVDNTINFAWLNHLQIWKIWEYIKNLKWWKFDENWLRALSLKWHSRWDKIIHNWEYWKIWWLENKEWKILIQRQYKLNWKIKEWQSEIKWVDKKEIQKWWWITEKTVLKNAKLSIVKRLEKAKNILWRELSQEQKVAIRDAHEIWKAREWAEVFNYTQKEILQKARILEEAWFKEWEVRILMENWIVWKAPEKILLDKIRWLFIKNNYQEKLSSINKWDIINIKTWNSEYVFEKLENWKYKLKWGTNVKLISDSIGNQWYIEITSKWNLKFDDIITTKIKWIEIIEKNINHKNYKVWEVVNISRSDWRIHEASIIEIDDNWNYIVSWEEKWKYYKKTFTKEKLDSINNWELKKYENLWKSNEYLKSIDFKEFYKNIDWVSQNIIEKYENIVIPKYKVTIDWRDFLLTDKYSEKIFDETWKIFLWNRKQVIAYTKVNWKYEPRLFYFSQSWWNWHSSPWIRTYDKGYSKWEWWNLSYEKWTVLETWLVDELNKLPEWWLWFNTDELYNIWFQDSKYQTKNRDIDNMIIWEDKVFANYWGEKITIQEMKDIIKNTPTWWIDINFKNIKKGIDWGFHQKLKQPIKLDIVETILNWEPIQIKFWYTADKPNLPWVEDIVFKNGNWINSFWFKKRPIHWWLLTTKPLEYTSQLPKWFRFINPYKKYKNYSDIRELIQSNPLIQAYKNQKMSF